MKKIFLLLTFASLAPLGRVYAKPIPKADIMAGCEVKVSQTNPAEVIEADSFNPKDNLSLAGKWVDIKNAEKKDAPVELTLNPDGRTGDGFAWYTKDKRLYVYSDKMSSLVVSKSGGFEPSTCYAFTKYGSLLIKQSAENVPPYLLINQKEISKLSKTKVKGACYTYQNKKPNLCIEFSGGDFLKAILYKFICEKVAAKKQNPRWVPFEMVWSDTPTCAPQGSVSSCKSNPDDTPGSTRIVFYVEDKAMMATSCQK